MVIVNKPTCLLVNFTNVKSSKNRGSLHEFCIFFAVFFIRILYRVREKFRYHVMTSIATCSLPRVLNGCGYPVDVHGLRSQNAFDRLIVSTRVQSEKVGLTLTAVGHTFAANTACLYFSPAIMLHM